MKIKLIPHTHWDREWYFTSEDSKILSTLMFDKIFDTLQNNKKFTSFCLDGQTSILEDYLKLKPHKLTIIKKLLKQKKLFIGPWYTQTDSFYVHPEAYIKNLYYGIKKAKELGGVMRVGYLPDTFGHNFQTPQLMAGFDIDNVFFWRGINSKEIISPYFNWKSLSGDEVLGINLTFGYGAAKWLKNDKNEWDNKIIPMAKKLEEISPLPLGLLPSGGDQVLIDENLPKTINALNKHTKNIEFKMLDYETFKNNLKDLIKTKNHKLKTYTKEFRYPELARIHRTIGSTRYDLKKLNYEIEDLIINKLQPLVVFYKKFFKQNVDNEVFEYVWKLVLDGHAHDSIGACNSDATNQNVINRFNQAKDVVKGLINFYKKSIATNIKNQNNLDLILFNFDTKVFSGVKEITLFSNTKAIEIFKDDKKIAFEIINVKSHSGGKKILVTPQGEKEEPLGSYFEIKGLIRTKLKPFSITKFKVKEIEGENKILESNNPKIEDVFYKIEVKSNQLQLLDKKTKNIIKDFIYLSNDANDGDSYDYSPIKNDKPLTKFDIKKISNIKAKEYNGFRLHCLWKLPEGLKSRKERSNKKIDQEFILEIKLFNDGLIRTNLDLINKVKDQRTRLHIKSLSKGELFTDVPFGFVKREAKTINPNWQKEMVEYPIDIYPIYNSTFLKGRTSLIAFVKGNKEVQALNNSELAFTLYTTYGYLGKDNLQWRPNRASGINNVEVLTPDAQLLNKQLNFEFAFSYSQNLSEDKIQNMNLLFNDRVDYYQVQTLNTNMNRLERFQLPLGEYKIDKGAIINIELANLQLSSIYVSPNNNAIIARFYNLNNSIMVDLAKEFKTFKKKTIVNYEERDLKKTKMLVNKYQTITIKLEQ